MATNWTLISTTVIAVAVIAGATVAVVMNHITGDAYVAILVGIAGLGGGAAVHSAGVAQGIPVTPPPPDAPSEMGP
jgi:hypothetical protein